MDTDSDTIAAIATPAGVGGVGIVRLSGPRVMEICEAVTGSCPPPRFARFGRFRDHDNTDIDHGIVLFFPSPGSYTGDDVVEFQGHGGPVVMDLLLARVVQLGARLARPGEFSERAFLNGRLDLVQAEAVADLIEASTRDAARLAMRSLKGELSKQVTRCAGLLMSIRTFLEAAIDFPEEEIDFLTDSDIKQQIETAIGEISRTREECDRGAILQNRFSVVLCGPPNVGKSSLLNALARNERAIVSATPGTTRDLIDETIRIGGVAVQLIDTAGLRENPEDIERQGIERALSALDQADLVIIVGDSQLSDRTVLDEILTNILPETPRLFVYNKIDLSGHPAGVGDNGQRVYVSAKTGEGLDALEKALHEHTRRGYAEGSMFLARRRHIDAMDRALEHIVCALDQITAGHAELTAEELRLGHRALGEITGEVTTDDLLSEIFGSFCIGK
ncbi:MAG: tRNA modification GTPase MnmE [marine bacterium B5-7]|nr:MAG: tRNA modification GTPase MnmE [marine bacterium B5-7]